MLGDIPLQRRNDTPMTSPHPDSFRSLRAFRAGDKTYAFHSLKAAEKNGLAGVSRLPVCLKLLLENLLRHEDGHHVRKRDIQALARWSKKRRSDKEIAFHPARVLMQDFTGVPALADLAALRDAAARLGAPGNAITPLTPVDLVIDHSVMVDFFGRASAFKKNVALEYQRNGERYAFLRWGAQAFRGFRVVPPGTGICHQVNLENLAEVTRADKSAVVRGKKLPLAHPDTLVGTDSHTTMINGLSVLGWGVGGIEAEAVMLGQPISMRIPEVVGFRLVGKLREGTTATDVVLTATEMLRAEGVVGKFVEFHGPGLAHLSLEDRATIANMAPEYGATCGFFPIDAETLRYLRASARPPALVRRVEAYAKAQGIFHTPRSKPALFSRELELDLSAITPSLAGPKRPQDRINLDEIAAGFPACLKRDFAVSQGQSKRHAVAGKRFDLGHGDVVIAAITSCTNTSNPSVMLGAGLLARNAVAKGLKTAPWVKSSLAPGSQVVSEYLQSAGLQKPLDALGFHLVGYGCTTCIGNSGPLDAEISATIRKHSLVVAGVLSGNRNFEGRINADVQANYLASPMLVVAYALAGSMRKDLTREPLRVVKGKPVWLRDIWPSGADIAKTLRNCLRPSMFRERYADLFKGDAQWRRMPSGGGATYGWEADSTYVRRPPFLDGVVNGAGVNGSGEAHGGAAEDIADARILALFGDSITTDHISPAGAIKVDSPAGRHLAQHGVAPADFNSYGARRGNHEVMMRGTFANPRLQNHMTPEIRGGFTLLQPEGRQTSIYEAAMKYRKRGVPLVVFAGKEYGTGSSRDWAAKGTRLLGARAVVAASFERIHRSNLIGMGVLPLQFEDGFDWRKCFGGKGLDGSEIVRIDGLEALAPSARLGLRIRRGDGKEETRTLLCRIDTESELDYFRSGGILPFVLRARISPLTGETT